MMMDPLPVICLDMLSDGQLTANVSKMSAHNPTSYLHLDWHMDLGQLHQRVSATEPLPEEIASKVIAFHFGYPSLCVDDVTRLLLLFERRFRTFAMNLPSFTRLSSADQESLMLSNAPIYVQLHLANYFNAGNGLEQLLSLIGDEWKDTESLAGLKQHLLTISLGYFTGATHLFKDQLWVDFFEVMVDKMSKLSSVCSDPSVMGLLTACIIFYQDSAFRNDEDCDDLKMVSEAFDQCVRDLLNEKISFFQSVSQIRQMIDSLRSMGHFYSAHANIRYMDSQNNNHDTEIIEFSTNYLNEDACWKEHQIRLFWQIWNCFHEENQVEHQTSAVEALNFSISERLSKVSQSLMSGNQSLNLDNCLLMAFHLLKVSACLQNTLTPKEREFFKTMSAGEESDSITFPNLYSICQDFDLFALLCMAILTADPRLGSQSRLMFFLGNELIQKFGHLEGLQSFIGVLKWLKSRGAYNQSFQY